MKTDTTSIFWPVYRVQFKITSCLIALWGLLQLIQMDSWDKTLNNITDITVIMSVFTVMYILFPLAVALFVTLLTSGITTKLMELKVKSKMAWASIGCMFALIYYGIAYFLTGLALSKHEPAYTHHIVYDYLFAIFFGAIGGLYFHRKMKDHPRIS